MAKSSISYHVRAAPVVLLAACLALTVLIGQLAEHAYVATIVIAAAMSAGLILPYLMLLCISLTVTSSERRGTVGVALDLTIHARNRLPIPIPVWLRFAHDDFATQTSFFVRPGKHVMHLKTVPHCRGEAELDRTRVCCDSPFGLATASKAVGGSTDLLIRPRPIETECPDLNLHSEAMFVDSASIDRVGDGEPVGVRPYRRGDSIRLIHWKQSARHEQLIVRERDRSRLQVTTILLDIDSAHYRNREDFETAVSIAAGLVQSLVAQRRRIVLIAGDEHLEVSSAAGLESCLDMLARVSMRPGAVARRQFGCFVITSNLAPSQTATMGQRLICVETVGGGATP